MVRISVAQMNTKLVELNTFFVDKTEEFSYQISLHQGKLTHKDFAEFEDLITDIKESALKRIKDFIDQKFHTKSQVYQHEITTYSQAHSQVGNELTQFSKYLEECTIELKEEQNKKQILLDHFSKNFSKNLLMKKAWKALNDYRIQRQQEKQNDRRMDDIYRRNLKKKAFFPWRTLTYKEGYENTVRRDTQTDIMNIHEQYKGIIDILKQKITETDNLIKVKKAAKGEFTYALSKNLLKTISNLSMQVMSLNQISLRDQEFDNQSTEKFMGDVDTVIREKLDKVRQYKREIAGENQQGDGPRRKKITFL